MSSSETLNDMVGQLQASLATANETLARIQAGLHTHILQLGGTVPMPASQPPPTPIKPITAPVILPTPVVAPTPPPADAGMPVSDVVATCWGNQEDEESGAWSQLAYSWAPKLAPGSGKTLLGASLPGAVSRGTTVDITLVSTGVTVPRVPVIDLGPWNIHDPYWRTPGRRPEAETGTDNSGRHTNRAGVDLTPAVWAKLLGKTPEECWSTSPGAHVNIVVHEVGAVAVRPSSTTTPVDHASDLARARSAIGKGILYSQDVEGTTGGDDPTAPLPGYHHPDGTITCDCSEYVAWAQRRRRADRWNTASMKADAHGSQECFSVAPAGQARVGDSFNYYDPARSTGHTGWISQVKDGMPTAVIHCHSGQAPAIQETGCEIFTSHGADILRYHGPQVG